MQTSAEYSTDINTTLKYIKHVMIRSMHDKRYTINTDLTNDEQCTE